MSLQLNDTYDLLVATAVVKRYELFPGRNIDQVPLLLSQGRIPLMVSGLFEKRFSAQDPNVVSSWQNNYYDCGNLCLTHPDKKIKIVSNVEYAKKFWELLNPDCARKLVHGALPLPDGFYESFNVQEFGPKEIEKYADRLLTKKEAKSNPFWKELIPDKDLRNNSIDKPFSLAKKQYNRTELMGIYPGSFEKVPIGRLWCVYGLDGSSSADGSNLNSGGGRFVGVAPEASESTDAKKYTLAQFLGALKKTGTPLTSALEQKVSEELRGK